MDKETRNNDSAEGYKETPIGRIPKEWIIGPLSEFVHINPRTTIPHLDESENIEFIPMENVGEDGRLIKMVFRPLTEIRNGYTVFKNGDILFAKITPCMEHGKGLLVRNLKHDIGLGSTEFHILRPIEDRDAEFIYQLTRFQHFRKIAATYFTGSAGQQRVSKEIFFQHFIAIPTRIEREKIAAILSIVDDAIAATDEVIAHFEQLKKGLMQEMLTKGIRHSEFKDTPIGRIPKEWDVVHLHEISKSILAGFASGERDVNGILQLRMNNISTDGRIILDSSLKVPIPNNIQDYLLKKGDVIFNNTNSVDLIGKSALFRGECSYCTFSNHLTRIRADKKKCPPEWIAYILLMKWRNGIFSHLCQRHVGQAGIPNDDLKSILVPLPSFREINKIAAILSGLDDSIDSENKYRKKLDELKKGLMQVLFNGEIRVTIDQEEPANA